MKAAIIIKTCRFHCGMWDGGKFVADRLRAWLTLKGTKTVYIAGASLEYGYGESFNGKFRDECLNEEVVYDRRYAQVVIEKWRKGYNEERPHSSLGYRTPAQVVRDSVVVAGTSSGEGSRLTS